MSPSIRRALVGLVVAAALGVFIFAFTLGGEQEEQVTRSGSAVERFIPADGSPAAVRQSEIGIDLAPGFTAVLLVDGVEIPDDQLRRNDPEAQLFFTPGEGKVIDALSPGSHTVTALVWRPVASQTRDDAQPYSWSFNAA
jgi:hypothetical protein